MWRRLRALLHPVLGRGSARDIDDEIEGYVADLTAKHRQAGLSDEEARRAALIEAGGIEQARDATRSVQPEDRRPADTGQRQSSCPLSD